MVEVRAVQGVEEEAVLVAVRLAGAGGTPRTTTAAPVEPQVAVVDPVVEGALVEEEEGAGTRLTIMEDPGGLVGAAAQADLAVVEDTTQRTTGSREVEAADTVVEVEGETPGRTTAEVVAAEVRDAGNRHRISTTSRTSQVFRPSREDRKTTCPTMPCWRGHLMSSSVCLSVCPCVCYTELNNL